VIHSLISVALVALSALAVATFPRSVLVFLLFQGSLLFVFKARIPERLRWSLLAIGLLVMMPTIGYFNSYYLEVATQVPSASLPKPVVTTISPACNPVSITAC